MSKASDIVKGKSIPAEYEEAADEMKAHIKQSHDVLDNPAKYLGRLEDENGNVYFERLSEDHADYKLLQDKLDNHGFHAYRYEEQSDGSVLALYVNDKSGRVRMKAFDSMAEASAWSPRDERE
jgi:hypothetical protein